MQNKGEKMLYIFFYFFNSKSEFLIYVIEIHVAVFHTVTLQFYCKIFTICQKLNIATVKFYKIIWI